MSNFAFYIMKLIFFAVIDDVNTGISRFYSRTLQTKNSLRNLVRVLATCTKNRKIEKMPINTNPTNINENYIGRKSNRTIMVPKIRKKELKIKMKKMNKLNKTNEMNPNESK